MRKITYKLLNSPVKYIWNTYGSRFFQSRAKFQFSKITEWGISVKSKIINYLECYKSCNIKLAIINERILVTPITYVLIWYESNSCWIPELAISRTSSCLLWTRPIAMTLVHHMSLSSWLVWYLRIIGIHHIKIFNPARL